MSTRQKTFILTLTTLIILSTHQTTQAQYSGGKGTPEDPCQISTTDEWLTLINSPNDWDNHFILTTDLEFAGASLTPIGNFSNKFTGVFDGAGFVIRNATINVTGTAGNDYVGLIIMARSQPVMPPVR
ncbi:MAG: hypothetical protein GY869_07960 [Planctomycetes bacterium]|nr:hypothetical protein [Planctomycetota bacterium]